MTKVENQTLSLFVERLKRLRNTRLARYMKEPGLQVEIWERPDGELDSIFPDIDQDDLDAFLMNWRLFTQKNERISVRRISAILDTDRTPPEIRQEFTRVRNALNAILDSCPIVPLDGAATNRDFIDTMLHGLFAHLEPEKYDVAKKWEEIHGHAQLRLLFVTALNDALKALEAIRTPVEAILARGVKECAVAE